MWRNTRTSYGAVSILLHWTIAALFLAQIGLGWVTQVTADHPRLQFDLYQWHKSTGFLVLLLAAIRIGWSVAGPVPKVPRDMPSLKAAMSRLVHILLMAATIVVPLTGWAIASSSPLRIPSLAFDLILVPDLPMTRSDAAEALWSRLHALTAYAAGVLATLHAGAALHHHFVLKDASLTSILPRRR